MDTKIVLLNVSDYHISPTGDCSAGSNSAASIIFRTTFSEDWEGMAIVAKFTDAADESITDILLTEQNEDGSWDIKMPHEAAKYDGEAKLSFTGALLDGETIDGEAINWDTVIKRNTTKPLAIRVIASYTERDGDNTEPITPTDAAQLQKAAIVAKDRAGQASRHAAEANEAKKEAVSAQGKAETAQAAAETAKTDAVSAKETAEAASKDAAVYAVSAEESATRASASASSALEAQSNAAQIFTQTQSLKLAAEAAKEEAVTAMGAAISAKGAAEAAQSYAEEAQKRAEAAAENAAAYAAYAQTDAADAQKAKTDAESAKIAAQAAAEEAQKSAVKINDANISKAETWSSQNIIDRLCPAFEESGAIVSCEPIEGYPLSVTAQEGATTITRTGENVFGGEKLRDTLKKADNGSYVLINETEKTVQFDPGGINRSGAAFNKFKPNTRYTVILYGCNTVADGGISNTRIRYTDGTDETLLFNNGKLGQNCSANELGYVIHTTKENKTVKDFLPIWGSGYTKLYYEKCGVFEGVVSVDEFQAYIGASFANGESVPALKGVNTLWANSGEITVAGRNDIGAMFEKLAAAIIAAGVN